MGNSKRTRSAFPSFVVSVLFMVAAGCTYNQISPGDHPLTAAKILREQTSGSVAPYRLRPGDEIEVVFYYQDELSNRVKIRPDGKISLSLVDEIQAAGRTPAELDEELTRLYSARLDDVDLSVIVREYMTPNVYVDGEVRNPSALPLRDRMNVIQAIATAGGAVQTADLRTVLLIRPRDDSTIAVASLNLNDLDQYESLYLQANDVIYVPQTTIAQVNQWVQQYLSNMMPEFMRLSFLYALNPTADRNIELTLPDDLSR